MVLLHDSPAPRRFTRDEFFRMIDAGILKDDEHVELLEGRVIVVPPQGPPHSYASTVLRNRLEDAYARDAVVREDKPLDCGREQVPEPDLAVVAGVAADYVERDPLGSEALLVVEVSRTTQELDRRKAAVYAAAGVTVYWLVDLVARRVELYEKPTERGEYALVRVLGEDEVLAPPGAVAQWTVREVLPPEPLSRKPGTDKKA